MTSFELADLAEKYFGCAISQRTACFQLLLRGLRHEVQSDRIEHAAAILGRLVQPSLDYTSAQSLLRIMALLKSRDIRLPHKTRLAVLGSFTTTQLVPLIELNLFALGIDAELYEADYAVFRQDILDPNSALYEFDPQIVLLATTWRDLARRPNLTAGMSDLMGVVEAEQRDWQALWSALHERLGCQIIQNNCVLPNWRTLSNHELRQPGSLHSYLITTNLHLNRVAPPFVTIHDVESLANTHGKRHWDDPRFVHQAKLPCAPEYLFDYAHNVASLVGAQLGCSKKCLVLDLDNTLWGGVIGDDGLGGIRLGQGEPEGEAFVAFQQYLKELQLRGVILAVCSKNNDATAREVFEKHPEMILRLPDIACFVANWADKAANLRTIASSLNLGLDSLVFVDDNPAERAIVRQLLPEVAVPELPEDPAGYVQTLDEQRYFQVTSVADEDYQRTEYYRANSLRQSAESSAGDLEEYLRSLEMIARIEPINPTTVERSAQLIQRSNQFNLTTRRRSVAELLALIEDDSWITLTVSLADRFGDNGLISVLLARVSEQTLEIDTWLMSCRVLKRGVEQFLLNHLCRLARERGLTTIRGDYIPTAKNSLVKNHYNDLGFRQVACSENRHSEWELDLTSGQKLLKSFIAERPTNAFINA